MYQLAAKINPTPPWKCLLARSGGMWQVVAMNTITSTEQLHNELADATDRLADFLSTGEAEHQERTGQIVRSIRETITLLASIPELEAECDRVTVTRDSDTAGEMIRAVLGTTLGHDEMWSAVADLRGAINSNL